MALGVANNGGRCVEAHGPSVEQGAGKHLGVVALEVGGGISNERKTGGMALWKAVFAEPTDLAENPLGKLRLDSFGGHTGNQLGVMGLDAAQLLPSGHIATQLVSFAGVIVGGHDGEFHHLFLEQRYSQGLLQHGLEQRMGISHLLLTRASPQVGVHHASGDGPRPYETHFNNDIVVRPWLEAREHGHLGAALDLKNAHGIGAANHIKGGRVAGGNGGHVELDCVVLLEKSEGVIELG